MTLHTAGQGHWTGKPRCGTKGGRQTADLTKVTCRRCISIGDLERPGFMPGDEDRFRTVVAEGFLPGYPSPLPPFITSNPPGPRSPRYARYLELMGEA